MVSYCHPGVGGQLLSACCCGQGLVVSYYQHVAVVRGWWSAIVTMLWSGVGGQLLSSCCCGQLLVVNCAHVLEKDPFAELSGKNQTPMTLHREAGHIIHDFDQFIPW